MNVCDSGYAPGVFLVTLLVIAFADRPKKPDRKAGPRASSLVVVRLAVVEGSIEGEE